MSRFKNQNFFITKKIESINLIKQEKLLKCEKRCLNELIKNKILSIVE